MPKLGRKVTKRRWRVDKTTGCWEWLLSKSNKGYGVTWTDRGQRYAHVVNYEKKYGCVPEGKILDHVVCDNRGCCNPNHVSPVTHAENIRRGKVAKLTMHKASSIRKAVSSGVSRKVLACRYEVSLSVISRVVNRINWA